MLADPTTDLSPLEGKWIEFKLCEVCHPMPVDLLAGAVGGLVLKGRVIAIAKGQEDPAWLVEVAVGDAAERMIVRTPHRPVATSKT